MTTEIITMVINHVQSQVLMRQRDVDSFVSWLESGNYDDEFDVAETKCRKGLPFSFSTFSMDAYKKFIS